MARVPFTKLAGTGNDFVLLDARRAPLASGRGGWPAVSRRLCNRRTGIGADGLLVLGRSRVADVRMRIFNPDGSEPSMCGNGVRCLALFASQHGVRRRLFTIETRAGIKRARIEGRRRVVVDLGMPKLLAHMGALRAGSWRTSHADVVDSGVPHLVCWTGGTRGINVEQLGRRLRRLRRFQPHGVNVDFVQWNGVPGAAGGLHRLRIAMRTYERGVEGETDACGTGAVAAAASAAHAVLGTLRRQASTRRRFEVTVRVPGGVLRVELAGELRAGRAAFGRACLEGDITQLAQGTVSLNGSLNEV